MLATASAGSQTTMLIIWLVAVETEYPGTDSLYRRWSVNVHSWNSDRPDRSCYCASPDLD